MSNLKRSQTYKVNIAAAVAGKPQASIRTWRRQGLRLGGDEGRGWARYSIGDVARLALVAELTENGITAGRAIEISNDHFEAFDDFAEATTSLNSLPFWFFLIARKGDDEVSKGIIVRRPGQLVDALMTEHGPGAAIVINLRALFARVTCHLRRVLRPIEQDEEDGLPLDARARQSWATSSEIREEFEQNFDAYFAYRQAVELGHLRFR